MQTTYVVERLCRVGRALGPSMLGRDPDDEYLQRMANSALDWALFRNPDADPEAARMARSGTGRKYPDQSHTEVNDRGFLGTNREWCVLLDRVAQARGWLDRFHPVAGDPLEILLVDMNIGGCAINEDLEELAGALTELAPALEPEDASAANEIAAAARTAQLCGRNLHVVWKGAPCPLTDPTSTGDER